MYEGVCVCVCVCVCGVCVLCVCVVRVCVHVCVHTILMFGMVQAVLVERCPYVFQRVLI